MFVYYKTVQLKDDVMNLIIFGPPGSGKGTYSSRLIKHVNIVKISTGDMFRDAIKNQTELGMKAKEYNDRGELVPDEIVIRMFKERIEQPDCKKGFILDGFPRTLPQAKALERIAKIDAIINIIAPDEILIEKISARRICKNTKCDGNYNIADIRKTIDGIDYILPPILPGKEGTCDKCGSELYQRKDDRSEVIKERLKVYEKQSKPLIKYYKRIVPFVNIHMNRPPEIIVERILEGLKKLGLVE